MAAEVELPRHIFIHGFLLMQGEKMSKTLGNVLDPFQVIDMYGVDALRYYCFREVSFGQDGSISTEGFESRYNTELANDYGNLASRTIAMIDRYRDGAVPQADAAGRAGGRLRRACARRSPGTSTASELTLALEEIWKRVRRLNQFVEQRAPWNLAKDDGAAGRAGRDPLRAGGGAARRQRAAAPLHPGRRRAGAGGAGRPAGDVPPLADAEFGARSGRRRWSGSRRSSRRSRPVGAPDRSSADALSSSRVERPPDRHAARRLGDLGRLLPADQDRAGGVRPGGDRVPARPARRGAPLCW